MAENSHIEWTDNTFNPWWGCCKVSDGCKHCYADALATRFTGTGEGKVPGATPLPLWGPTASRKPMSEGNWKQPIRWNKQAGESGKRARVFCASMADVFEGPETCQNAAAYAMIQAARERLWKLIEATPNLDWLLLTKRPQNILEMVPAEWKRRKNFHDLYSFPVNVWVGTSVEDQKTADERIPHLARVPAAVHFLSMEPLLGPVDLALSFYGCKSCGYPLGFDAEGHDEESATAEECAAYARFSREGCAACGRKHGYYAVTDHISSIDWVIVGGESGPKARPMHPGWVREIRDQCEHFDVAFFFKQWGEYRPFDEKIDPAVYADNLKASKWDPKTDTVCVGKKAAGRLLDGRTWDDLPFLPEVDFLNK